MKQNLRISGIDGVVVPYLNSMSMACGSNPLQANLIIHGYQMEWLLTVIELLEIFKNSFEFFS